MIISSEIVIKGKGAPVWIKEKKGKANIHFEQDGGDFNITLDMDAFRGMMELGRNFLAAGTFARNPNPEKHEVVPDLLVTMEKDARTIIRPEIEDVGDNSYNPAFWIESGSGKLCLMLSAPQAKALMACCGAYLDAKKAVKAAQRPVRAIAAATA